jgi:isopentenyl diphosphate isomerase/L-lactate dehydrogenase-like FMN-dependent dehydrogenase
LTTGLENYRFLHRALPELNLSEIDSTVELFGKKLSAPLLISSMTGGAEMAYGINRNLAQAAQKYGIAMGALVHSVPRLKTLLWLIAFKSVTWPPIFYSLPMSAQSS